MKVLITGGAGYIGSHACLNLLESGHEVYVIDNLSNGHKAALDRVQIISNCHVNFQNVDIRDSNALDKIFKSFQPDAVIHFAGLKSVAESVINPLKYYDVNVIGSINLLDAMARAGCLNIVFSSSATVYGNPLYLPYDESHPTTPINPYGRSKLMIEEMIRDWVSVNKDRKGISLRYFNPVGAHKSGQIGEHPHGSPDNLMPYISQVAAGRRKILKIFRNNYETNDGTCSRDYIHVVDLANAHNKALKSLVKIKKFEILNIGSGSGVSVLDLVKAFESATGIPINFEFAPRREGALASFWADSSRANKLLNWKPLLTIDRMCIDAWRWQKNNLDGYNSIGINNAEY
jgi:UDP-glucose 4-epimerase